MTIFNQRETTLSKGLSHWRPEDLEHLLDGLRQAGWDG
jgi:hypothetical protein